MDEAKPGNGIPDPNSTTERGERKGEKDSFPPPRFILPRRVPDNLGLTWWQQVSRDVTEDVAE